MTTFECEAIAAFSQAIVKYHPDYTAEEMAQAVCDFITGLKGGSK